MSQLEITKFYVAGATMFVNLTRMFCFCFHLQHTL